MALTRGGGGGIRCDDAGARRLVAVVAGAMPCAAHAQQDMVGPSWMQLLLAAPKLVLYAIGEFALFVAPLLALAAILSWLLPRLGIRRGSRLPGTPLLAVLAVLAAVPAGLYWAKAPEGSPDPSRSYRSSTVKDRKVAPLAPPAGKSWPKATGYLDLPQSARGGHGVIRVSGKASLHDAYVKLCEAGRQPCPGLRHAFIARFEEFRFGDLPPGDYEVRYMRVDRPIVGGRSRPISIPGHAEAPHSVIITDSPVLDSNDPVVGIRLKDF